MSQRILHIIPTLDRGGAEKQMTLLATGLAAADFDVQVCVLTRDGPLGELLKSAGIDYHVVHKTWKADPSAYLRLRRQIKRLKPDVVHTWLFAANSYGRFAARSQAVKCIIASERCVDSWKSWRELAVDRYLAKRTNRIVANSESVREFYALHGIDPDLFLIIPNAVEKPTVDGPQKRAELISELGLPADARLIGFVGRLWPQKRVKDLIWAADLLKCVRDDTHLLIVGDGPQRWRLERYRDQADIRDRVHFLGERSDARDIISALDCLWLASAFEGQSNAVLEAMAAGVPVVATDIAGMRDLVIPGETGLLVPLGDRAEFTKQTRLILDDKELSGKLSANSIARAEREFSLAQMIDRHAALYRTYA